MIVRVGKSEVCRASWQPGHKVKVDVAVLSLKAEIQWNFSYFCLGGRMSLCACAGSGVGANLNLCCKTFSWLDEAHHIMEANLLYLQSTDYKC